MIGFQVIPVCALVAYILYLSYYFVIPTGYIRLLITIADKVYHCKNVRFNESSISLMVCKGGKQELIVRPIAYELGSRHFVWSACSELRRVLREIRKGAFQPQ